VHKEAHNLPTWAEENPAAFFAAAEQYERANGRFSTTWEIALPRELSREHQITAVRDFLHTQFADRHPYAWAMHESRASDGATNPHVHVIFSSRTLDGIERDAAQFFRRYNPEHPEQGGAQKAPFFTERRAITASRQAWADVANWHLEHAGVTARIDPRNLREQGVRRDPETRLDPYHSTQAKYQGTLTPAWQETLQARVTRQADKPQEAAQAFRYWEARKTTLGLAEAHRISRDEFLDRIAQQTRQPQPARAHLGVEALRAQEQALEIEVHRQEHYVHRLHAEVMQEDYRQRTGKGRSAAAEARIDAMLREEPAQRLDAPLIGNLPSKIYHMPGQPNYGDVHPKHQVLFWSYADAEAAGFRVAANSHYGQGSLARREAEARETAAGMVTGRLLGRQRVGDRDFALIERDDGEHALVPWHASLDEQLGKATTLQHAAGHLVHVASLDDDVPARGAVFRFRDRGRDVGY
jgi:hypothetical protein